MSRAGVRRGDGFIRPESGAVLPGGYPVLLRQAPLPYTFSGKTADF